MNLLFLRHSYLFGILACLVLAGSNCLGQTGQNSGPRTLEELWEQLDNLDVKVTIASKLTENIADAPSSVTVFTRSEIHNMGVQTLEELLNFVPGFHVGKEVENGPQGFITARFARTGFSNTVLVLMDGIRLNVSHSGEGSLGTRFIRLDNVHQVEIIRGPGSALYGGNAFMGVVNILTEKETNELYLGVGSNEGVETALQLSGRKKDFRYSAFAGFFADQGQNYQQLTDAAQRRSDTTDPREGSQFQFDFRYRRLALNLLHQRREFEDFYQFRLLGNGVNRDRSSFTAARLDYHFFEQNQKKQLNLYMGAGEWHWDALTLLAPKGEGLYQEADFVGGPLVTNFDRNLGLDYHQQFEKHNLSAGASYRQTGDREARSQFNYDFSGNYLGAVLPRVSFNREDFTRKVLGLWVQDRIQLSSRIKATFGARWDHYNDVGSSFNPRGALIYETGTNGHGKLMYGEAFRAPSLTELYNSSPVSVGNPDLEPEKIRTLELAWFQDIDDVTASLTFFRNEIDQIITTVPLSTDSLGVTFVNGDEARVEGLELELYGRFLDFISLRAGYSHALKTYSDLTPDNTGFLICNLKQDWFNLNFSTHYRGGTDILFDDSSHLITNGKFQLKAMKRLSLSLVGRNLTDEEVRVSVLSLPEQGVPERGREWLFSMTLVLL